MELAALDDLVVEHVADRVAQRLGAVDHHQDGPGDLQAAVAQPGQQVADDRGVLGRALGQSEGDLGPIDGDAEGDHTAVLGDPDPVDHERDQLQPGQVGGQQLGQRPLGRGDEPARDRRLRRPGRVLLDPAADRLQPRLVCHSRGRRLDVWV
jgi:hypothetical protein